MGEKITIVELAKMANVSTATISRVINNSGKVDPKKKELILDLIEKYNYKPNYIAKSLQSSKSNIIGFIVPHINSPYYAQVFFETELIAQKLGYTLMLCNSEGKPELESQIMDTLVSTNVKAIVFMGGRLDDITCDKKYYEEIEKINKTVPVICCVRVPELKCVQVYEDQHDSSLALLQHLSEMGYKDVLLSGGYKKDRTTKVRREEIIANAEKYGINLRKEMIDSGYSVSGGNNTMEAISKFEKYPDAIICINDLVATGLLSEVQRHGLNVPEDLAIVGYDNMEVSQFIYPGLTTLSTDYKAYAQKIVQTIQEIDDIEPDAKRVINRELVIRGTTLRK